MLYKIKQELKGLLYKNVCIEKTLFTPTPSFPRKRESMLTLRFKMDSRFRGNDEKRG